MIIPPLSKTDLFTKAYKWYSVKYNPKAQLNQVACTDYFNVKKGAFLLKADGFFYFCMLYCM